MAEDYFKAELALNPTTNAIVRGAVAQVYAMTDTSYSTPLSLTDMSGVSLSNLTASPDGVYPPFKCSGHTQVIAKVGDVTTPLTSLLGHLMELVPDPNDADDGDVVTALAGQFVLAPPSGGGVGSGILTFPVGADTSSVPEGGVFGTYVAPVVSAVPQRIGSLVQTSGGTTTATTVVLDLSTPTTGTAVANDDWMVVVVGANAPGAGEDWTAPAGWTNIRGDFSLIGTQRVRVYAKKRVSGDSTYTFTFASSKHLNAAAVWVRGAGDISGWVLGAGKDRSASPAETVTTTAPAITSPAAATLALAISVERTTSTEASVAWAGATQWLFAPQVGSSVITYAVGYNEMTAPGTSAAVTVTYPNAQSVNGWAFQIGIPGV